MSQAQDNGHDEEPLPKIPRKSPERLALEELQNNMALIEERVRSLEEQAVQFNRFLKNPASNARAQGAGQGQIRPCLFCEDRHPPRDCTVRRTRAERIEWLVDKHRCTRCLKNHGGKICKAQNACHRCQQMDHNQLESRNFADGELLGGKLAGLSVE